jgi:hypothetical protein
MMHLAKLALIFLLAPQSLQSQSKGLNPTVLDLALKAASSAQAQGHGKKNILAIIDYSLPSTKKRLWIFDLQKKKLLFREQVAHGKGSGNNYAKKFSNREGTLASSLGLFEATETYQGKHGYTLKLKGLEKGFNHNAEKRSIVIHGAWYVTEAFWKKHGRLGRSWGCPALDKKIARKVIDTLKGGSLLFIYYPDKKWLANSEFLKPTVEDLLRAEAKAWKGTPHALGGNSKKGVDCSGFAQIVYKKLFDVSLPRTSAEQQKTGTPVKRSAIRPGDLVFFSPPTYKSHTGIYLGQGEFLHVSENDGVTTSRMDEKYWQESYKTARRVLP